MFTTRFCKVGHVEKPDSEPTIEGPIPLRFQLLLFYIVQGSVIYVSLILFAHNTICGGWPRPNRLPNEKGTLQSEEKIERQRFVSNSIMSSITTMALSVRSTSTQQFEHVKCIRRSEERAAITKREKEKKFYGKSIVFDSRRYICEGKILYYEWCLVIKNMPPGNWINKRFEDFWEESEKSQRTKDFGFDTVVGGSFWLE
jgi:hypothetical protein